MRIKHPFRQNRYMTILTALLTIAVLTLAAACGGGEPTPTQGERTGQVPATQVTPAQESTTEPVATGTPTGSATGQATRPKPERTPAPPPETQIPPTQTPATQTPAVPVPAPVSQGGHTIPPYLSEEELNCFDEPYRLGHFEIDIEDEDVRDIINSRTDCFTDETLLRITLLDDMLGAGELPAEQRQCVLGTHAAAMLRTTLQHEIESDSYSTGLLYAALLATVQELAQCLSPEIIENVVTQEELEAAACMTGHGKEAVEYLRQAIDGTGEYRTPQQFSASCQEAFSGSDLNCLTGTPTDQVICLGEGMSVEPTGGEVLSDPNQETQSIELAGGVAVSASTPRRQPVGDDFDQTPPPPVLTTFKDHGTNPYINASEDNLSTFALDGDTASFQYALALMTEGHPPQEESVRAEEWINAVGQGYDDSLRRTAGLALHLDGTAAPYADHAGTEQHLYRTLRVGVLSPEVQGPRTTPVSLILVLDTSGSMGSPVNHAGDSRLRMAKHISQVLLDQLGEGDRAGIVVYEQTAYIVEPMPPHRPGQYQAEPLIPADRRGHLRGGRHKKSLPDGRDRAPGWTSREDRRPVGRRRQHRKNRPSPDTRPNRRAVPPGRGTAHNRYRILAQLQRRHDGSPLKLGQRHILLHHHPGGAAELPAERRPGHAPGNRPGRQGAGRVQRERRGTVPPDRLREPRRRR